ncbi:hypothetical protein LCGC14_0689250 [marine sediment metagenome]|uniref:DUF11 domain-containing protein n=1 Tax=marine sediment metagenome TaxID=412755 RepID=A0A0F9R6B7_9ZZZZ|nr:hypothetical protein [archaeon]
MGFKKVSDEELKTNIGQNFLGMPIRESGKMIQSGKREKKIDSRTLSSSSEILILNEEFLEYQYKFNRKRSAIEGYGNIVIFNNSLKDRIWDAFLKFSGTQFKDQDSEKGMNLGIFDPNSNKILKYEIVNSGILPDLITVNESIENLREDLKSESEGTDLDYNQKNHILLLGKENKIKFTISIENISNSKLENIKVKKYFSNIFYDFDFSNSVNKEFEFTKNYFECPIRDLNPREKFEIILNASVFPKRRENIRTGRIEITLNLKDETISEVEINNFSAYSHAMHAIKKVEKDYAPNNWNCSFIFENHSDFNMKLNSILIFDKSRKNSLLELDFSENPISVYPRQTYKTENFDFKDEKEPTFSRKVKYSIDYKVEKNSMITSRYDDIEFKVASILIKKNLAEHEIKSFEESKINTEFIVKNRGTVPIKGIIAQERIPEDFLPPRDVSNFQFLNSSGKLMIEDITLSVKPDDNDPSHEHFFEISINLKNNHANALIPVDDFLEVRYPLVAVNPDYKKDYEFKLEIKSHYSKYLDSDLDEYYIITDKLSEMGDSHLKVTHKRRKLMIGKEIFPGRSSNEFAIFITAKNGSNMKLSEVSISDTFPDSFELVSTNIDHKLTKAEKSGERTISFKIEALQPFQEQEIMYYLKNVTGKDIKFSELESFFVG